MKFRLILLILILGVTLAGRICAQESLQPLVMKRWQVDAIHRVVSLLDEAGNKSGGAALKAELSPVDPPLPKSSWLAPHPVRKHVGPFEEGGALPPRTAIAAAANLLADLGYPAEALEFVGAFTAGDRTSGEKWWVDPQLFLESEQVALKAKSFRLQQFYSAALTAAVDDPRTDRVRFRAVVLTTAWDLHRWAPRPEQLESFYVHLLSLLDGSDEDRSVVRTLQYLRAQALRRLGSRRAEVRGTLRRLYRHLLRESREHPDPQDRSFYRQVRREWMDLLRTWGEHRALQSLAEDVLLHTRRYRDFGSLAIQDRMNLARFLEPGPAKARLIEEADRFR